MYRYPTGPTTGYSDMDGEIQYIRNRYGYSQGLFLFFGAVLWRLNSGR
jgi:hypothetical protein